MILVGKKVWKERKNYLNMAIRYKKFLKLYKSDKNTHILRRRNKKGKFRVKKLRLNKTQRILFVKKLYRLGYKKRYFFYYLRQKVESIRLKKFLVKYR